MLHIVGKGVETIPCRPGNLWTRRENPFHCELSTVLFMHLFSTFVCVSQHFSSFVLSMLFHRFYSSALKNFSFTCFSLYICILPGMCCTNKRISNLTFAWLCVLACIVLYNVRLLYTFMYIIVNGDFEEDLQFCFVHVFQSHPYIHIQYSILFDVYTVQHNYVRLTTLNMYIVQQCT